MHIEEIGSTNWWNHILFRDYLRSHDDIRDEYAKLKKTLAKEYADDREIYTVKKVDFILDTVEKAKNQFYIKEKK
ncbi:GrpB family protein [Clostridium sp. D2Q-14]|nr:GrpB family protein [Anaeromonas gelatinilytica]